jgi:uncharacterized Zn finger protein
MSDELTWECPYCATEGTAYGDSRADEFTFECENCGRYEDIIGVLASENDERMIDYRMDER